MTARLRHLPALAAVLALGVAAAGCAGLRAAPTASQPAGGVRPVVIRAELCIQGVGGCPGSAPTPGTTLRIRLLVGLRLPATAGVPASFVARRTDGTAAVVFDRDLVREAEFTAGRAPGTGRVWRVWTTGIGDVDSTDAAGLRVAIPVQPSATGALRGPLRWRLTVGVVSLPPDGTGDHVAVACGGDPAVSPTLPAGYAIQCIETPAIAGLASSTVTVVRDLRLSPPAATAAARRGRSAVVAFRYAWSGPRGGPRATVIAGTTVRGATVTAPRSWRAPALDARGTLLVRVGVPAATRRGSYVVDVRLGFPDGSTRSARARLSVRR